MSRPPSRWPGPATPTPSSLEGRPNAILPRLAPDAGFVSLSPALYETFAIVHRTGARLSPAAQLMIKLATERILPSRRASALSTGPRLSSSTRHPARSPRPGSPPPPDPRNGCPSYNPCAHPRSARPSTPDSN